jgi:hypothetical protein
VQPNATCPVCGDRVFYYANKFGSRVFFDELGWPWPKHACTDRRTIRTPPPVTTYSTPTIRARGVRIEITDAIRRAEITPFSNFESRYGRTPPALFKIVGVSRKGFLNVLEVVAISPEADENMFIEFTSAKVVPEVGAFVSFLDGKVWLINELLERVSFQARLFGNNRTDALFIRSGS